MNQNVNNYRIGIRSKKWYWSIFTWLLDVTIQNAWIIYRQFDAKGTNISLLDFKLRLANYYCKINRAVAVPRNTRHFEDGYSIPPEIRFDRTDHWIGKYGKDQKGIQIRQRCKLKDCNTRSPNFCEKCQVALCDTCFKSYHTQ